LNIADNYAKKIESEMKKIPFLRDVRIAEPVSYPSVQINVNRELAAQFGLTMEDVTRALTIATSSTRFTNKNLWVDPKSGLVFQVQLQIPEADMKSLDNLRSLPLKSGQPRPVLEDVATLQMTKLPAQVNRQGPNRYVTIIANTFHSDLGAASKAVNKVLKNAGKPPRGVIITTSGLMKLLDDTMSGFTDGPGGRYCRYLFIACRLLPVLRSFGADLAGCPRGSRRKLADAHSVRKYIESSVLYGYYHVRWCFRIQRGTAHQPGGDQPAAKRSGS